MVFTYNDETNSDTCETVVCTSDTTPDLTCGSEVACDGDGTTDYYPIDVYTSKLDTDKWISCWMASDSTGDQYCVVGTTSGTTITYDIDPSSADSGATEEHSICTPNENGGTVDRFI